VEEKKRGWSTFFALLVGAALSFAIHAMLSKTNEKEPEKIPDPVVDEVARPAGRVGETAENGDCSCASGAVCAGPKGGRYCLSETGTKRYLTTDSERKLRSNS